jgi:dTDP-4-amino-4,6-dideoxygalactose transaminase
VTWRVPFNRPTQTGTELAYIAQAFENGHLSGDGPFTQECEKLLESVVDAPRALLTTSGTHALELAALLLDIGPEDEVIVPSFTFVSTAAAFALRGARIVFADIRPDTFNLDESLLAGLISDRTHAVVAVHYAGTGCDVEALSTHLEGTRAVLVEDNAHGLFGSYRGRPLGSFGKVAACSFHETKNVTCGEGGALVINDESLVERAEILREKGTERKRMSRGQVDKYTWSDLGSSYVLSELNAAALAAQLAHRTTIQRARCRIWNRYHSSLGSWAQALGATLPVVPHDCRPAFHMYQVLLPSLEMRTALIEHLRESGILAVFHYLPLHLSAMGKRFGGRAGACPVAEDVSSRLLRLPFYTSMTDAEQDEVFDALNAFACRVRPGTIRGRGRAARPD